MNDDPQLVNVIPLRLPGFHIGAATEVRGKLVIVAYAIEETAVCPVCGEPSRRIHSRYTRSLRDLPCGGQMVQLILHVRRFKCVNAMCTRKTFAERLPAVMPVHAQRTRRLTATLRRISFDLGGEAGARVARRFAIEVSGDTILRIMHRADLDAPEVPRVLGIDDWAIKKGQNYGTILVDLERHRPVDLLPDREADTVAAWLQAHPGVEIISRDRGKEYIEGATRGAPDAVQVADRWHLLKNLGDVLWQVFRRQAKALRAAARQVQERTAPAEPVTEVIGEAPVEVSVAVENETAPSHRQMRFNEVKQLAAKGYGQRAIARQLHMSRKTVRQYLHQDELPEYDRAPPATTKVTAVLDATSSDT